MGGFQKLFKKKSINRRSKNMPNNTGHDNDSINSTSGSLYDRYEINEGVEITTDHYDKVKSIGKVMTKEECNNCGDSTHNNEANNDIMFGSMMMMILMDGIQRSLSMKINTKQQATSINIIKMMMKPLVLTNSPSHYRVLNF